MAPCQVWWAWTSSRLAGHTSLLSPVERRRAAAYRRPADRQRFVVGVVVTRLVLAEWLGVPADRVLLSRRCARCGGPHGRPRLEGDGISFSVSHSGDRVVVAFMRDAMVGVDVEALDRSLQVGLLADTVLAPSERACLADAPDRTRAFLTCWTRKEAVVKATGIGLDVRLPGIVVSPAGEPPALLRHETSPVLVESTNLATLHPGAGYVAALAVIGDSPTSVTELDAEVLDGDAR